MKSYVRDICLWAIFAVAFAALEVLGSIFQGIERGLVCNHARLLLYAFFNAGIVMTIMSLLHRYVYVGMLAVTTVYGIFSYMNLLHYRALDSFFPFYMLTETQQLNGLSGSIFGVMRWYDVSYLVVMLAMCVLYFRLRKKEDYKVGRHLLILGVYMSSLLIPVWCVNSKAGWEFGKWKWNAVRSCKFSPVDCYTNLGLLPVIAYQLDNIQDSVRGLSDEELRDVEALLRENVDSLCALPTAVEPKQNLVIMLLESFNTSCVCPEVMPRLDSLCKQQTTLYFPKNKHLTHGGMSIGGQLVAVSGLHGLLNAPFCSAYPYNAYPSIARAQKDACDTTYAYSVVSSDRYFWRQSEVSEALGFDALFDKADGMTGVNKHGWADDKSVFEFTLAKVPVDGTVFTSLLVPTNMHSPYTKDEWIKCDVTFPEVKDESLHEYMRRAWHLDGLIGEFVGELKSKGVYDNTLLVIVSDHQVPEMYCSEDMNEWLSPYVPVIFVNAGEQWSELNDQCREVVCCMSQLYPTMLQLMGLKSEKYMGLFPPMTDLTSTREFDFENLEYTSTSCERLKHIYEIEERMIQTGYFGTR